MVAKFTVVLAAVGALMFVPASARAQPYLGWDFGHGFGIGVGVPPSAYDPCPTYGWGRFYPYGCHRYGSRRVWIPGHWRAGYWVPGHWA
jgi:hypothetical protein